jgi:hypothetical protein
MNAAEKQEASVVKVLGELAYNDVFIYETDNEDWIALVIRGDLMRNQVAKLFNRNFDVKFDEKFDNTLLIRNNKIAKAVA